MTHIHSFDINLAKKYSIEEALLIAHFQFWIRINRTRNKNIIEGRCWTYQTIQQIKDHFPYWSYETVKYFIEKLVEKKVIIKQNFNKRKMDKTCWYAFSDEKAFGVNEQQINELNTENSNNVYERENSLIDRENSLIDEGKFPKQYHSLKTESKEQIRKDNVFREPDKPRQEVKTMETVSFSVDQKKTVSEALAKRWALNQHQLISLNYLLEQHVPAAPPTLAFWAKTYSLEKLREIVAYAKSRNPANLAGYIQKLLRKNVIVENAVALKNREVAEYFAKAHMPGRLKVLKRYCVLTLEDGVTYDLEYQMDSENFYRALECKI